jgi:hypothetical protein
MRLNRHRASQFLIEQDLRANAFRVCREEKPLHTFPDHALKQSDPRFRSPSPAAFARPSARKIRVRLKTNFARAFNAIPRVQSCCEKYSTLR